MIYMYLNGTKGEQNGTRVSEGGTFTNAIKATLNASQNEISDPIEVQIRCDENYSTVGNVTLTITGATANKVCLSKDNLSWEDWGAPLTLVDANIGDKNVPVFVKLKAEDTESAFKDTQAKLRLEAVIQSVK